MKIVDENGRILPVGEVGTNRLWGNVTPGHYQDREETNRVLKESWLFTGDRHGRMMRAMSISLTGKDLIILRRL